MAGCVVRIAVSGGFLAVVVICGWAVAFLFRASSGRAYRHAGRLLNHADQLILEVIGSPSTAINCRSMAAMSISRPRVDRRRYHGARARWQSR